MPLAVWLAGLVVVQAALSFVLLNYRVAPQLRRAPAPPPEVKSPGRPETLPGASAEVGPLQLIEPMVMNLVALDGEKPSFVKIGLALEVDPQISPALIEERLPLVRDAIIRVITAKTQADVTDAAGKEILRQEMLTGLRDVFGHSSVRNLYYTHFVVQ